MQYLHIKVLQAGLLVPPGGPIHAVPTYRGITSKPQVPTEGPFHAVPTNNGITSMPPVPTEGPIHAVPTNNCITEGLPVRTFWRTYPCSTYN